MYICKCKRALVFLIAAVFGCVRRKWVCKQQLHNRSHIIYMCIYNSKRVYEKRVCSLSLISLFLSKMKKERKKRNVNEYLIYE